MNQETHYEPVQIFKHLRGFFFSNKNTIVFPLIKQTFFDFAGDKTYPNAGIRILFKHASETGQTDINGRYDRLWGFYSDYLVKAVDGFDKLDWEMQNKKMIDMIVFSKWNARNFPAIMGFTLPEDPPPYGAAPEEVGTFKMFLSYMQSSIVPVLKASLSERLQINEEKLGAMLSHREEHLIRSELEGLEILKPFSEGTRFPKPREPAV